MAALSNIVSGALGSAVMSLTLGAAQLASGHDIGAAVASGSTAPTSAAVAAPSRSDLVNRSAKSDRFEAVRGETANRTRVIAVQGDAGTSTLMRVQLPLIEADNARPAVQPARTPQRRTVGCEPVVSVLVDVVKTLQPGRCMT